MLMNDKIMFDRYYCIKKTHQKIEKNSSALPPFSYARTLYINILDSGRVQVLFLMMIGRLSVAARRVYKYNSVAGVCFTRVFMT